MDSVKTEQWWYKTCWRSVKSIAAIKINSELTKLLPELYNPYLILVLVYVDADPMNSNSYLVQTYQINGISLGEREYYLDNDIQTSNIRNKYKGAYK